MLSVMRQVEFHRYWVSTNGRTALHLTDFVMDAETAERMYPGAIPEPSSRVVLEEPETEEERIERMSQSQPAKRHPGKPPAPRIATPPDEAPSASAAT